MDFHAIKIQLYMQDIDLLRIIVFQHLFFCGNFIFNVFA